METIGSLQVVIESYEKWLMSRDQLDLNNYQQKEIKKRLELKINRFWQTFIEKNKKKLMNGGNYFLEEGISNQPIRRFHGEYNITQIVIARVEKMITTYSYKSIYYAARDLNTIYKEHKQGDGQNFRKEPLEKSLLQYVLNLIEQAIKIPDPNQYFRDFIINHYDELTVKIRKKYPKENATSLLQEVYKVLTTRDKDKLPPSDKKEDVVIYILQACKFIVLSATKKKKENKKFSVI
ncbi:MAG: hypothetical protein ACRBFS_17070 [Aureispira sp.]